MRRYTFRCDLFSCAPRRETKQEQFFDAGRSHTCILALIFASCSSGFSLRKSGIAAPGAVLRGLAFTSMSSGSCGGGAGEMAPGDDR